jgi:hypothetical protein
MQPNGRRALGYQVNGNGLLWQRHTIEFEQVRRQASHGVQQLLERSGLRA